MFLQELNSKGLAAGKFQEIRCVENTWGIAKRKERRKLLFLKTCKY